MLRRSPTAAAIAPAVAPATPPARAWTAVPAVLTTLAVLLTAMLAACEGNTPTEPLGLSDDTRRQLVEQETGKWTKFFAGSVDMAWYENTFTDDFVNVGDGPTGVTRSVITYAATRNGPAFPALPANAFTVSEMLVVPAGGDGAVLTYRVTGPGPLGPGWSAYATSVWRRDGGRWRTVFYQATPVR